MEKIVLSKEDLDSLNTLYKTAQTTPMILLFGKYDISRDAWNAVRTKMLSLGEVYGFNPESIKGIDPTTGVVNFHP